MSRSKVLGIRLVAALLCALLLPVLSAAGASAEGGLPSAPLNVQATQTDLDTLEVTWGPPADDGGHPITGYQASCRWWVYDGEDTSTTHEVTGSPLRIDLSHLERGTHFRCDIAATVGDPGTPGETAPVVAFATRTDLPPTVVDLRPSPNNDTWWYVDVALPAGIAGELNAECVGMDGTTVWPGMQLPVRDGNFEAQVAVPFDSLVTGREYDCTARVVNALGDFSSPVYHGTTTPGRPSAIGYEALSPRTVELSFDVADGGEPIIEREARCSSVDPVSAVDDGPLVVDGLVAGSEPICYLRARNAKGWGPSSSVMVDLPPGVPDAPTIRDAEWGVWGDDWHHSTAAEISVREGRHNGGAELERLQVRCGSSDGGESRTRTVDAPAYSPNWTTMHDLSSGLRYSCRARYENAVGWGPWSEPSRVKTRPDRPRRARWVKVRRVDARAARLRFEVGRHERSPIHTVRVGCRSLDGRHYVKQRMSLPDSLRRGDVGKVRIDGLRKRKRYECRVKLQNDSIAMTGWSGWSEYRKQDVKSGKPARASRVKARRVKPRVAKLRFTVGRTHGKPVTKVKAACETARDWDSRTGNRRHFKVVKRRGDRAVIPVRDLRKGRAYRCRVKVRNAHGWSMWSDWYFAF